MVKKKEDGYLDLTTDLVTGGTGLTLGAGIVGSLPASGAQTGVQAGLTTAGGFIKPMASLAGAGIVTKQLRGLNKSKEESEGGFRI